MTTQQRDEVDLMEFGFTPLQSKIYAALLKIGPTQAGKLCAFTEIVRPEVYRILRELASRDLVQRTPGAPSTYSATPPELALSLILSRFKEKLQGLEKKKTGLLRSFQTYPRNKLEIVEGRFNAIMGADNVVVRARELVSEVREEYAAIMSKYALKRADEDGVTKAIFAAKRRKAQVRIISEIDESNSLVADRLAKKIEIRRSDEVLFYLDIFDKKQILFGPAITDVEATGSARRDIDLWTNNSRFVAGMYALFEHLWRASTEYE
ncbi:MAG TPA: helix-turn-helix domain-containing protein [Candidatus Acidoferrales bacterium]|nr:helix-turn-helix domain-containing protein [Candidatus Acidoferrales bacterium]